MPEGRLMGHPRQNYRTSEIDCAHDLATFRIPQFELPYPVR